MFIFYSDVCLRTKRGHSVSQHSVRVLCGALSHVKENLCLLQKHLKQNKPGGVMLSYNRSTHETEAGGLLQTQSICITQ